MLQDRINILEKDPAYRFSDATIERCNKETEELIATETAEFLEQPIEFLRKQQAEFIYLESKWFQQIGVEGVTLEHDDVFRTYGVLLGIKLKKKFETAIKETLEGNLQDGEAKFALMFNQDDGVWDLNFSLNYVEGFSESVSIAEAYRLIYNFLFHLVEAVEEQVEATK